MAEAGGGGQQQVSAQDARAFAANFVHDPKVLESMAEPDVIAYHGKVRGAVDTQVQEALKQRGEFGPNWQKAIAGDNADELKTLERFKSPQDLYKSYSELRNKVSKGELKTTTPYPEKGTAEQQAQWRAEQGIPATAKEYKIELRQGQVLGEEDQPIVESFLESAHKANMPPSFVNSAIQWFLSDREKQVEAAAEANKTMERDTEDALRKDWGEDYRGKVNTINGMLDSTLATDSEMRPLIENTIKRNPEFAKWLDGLASQINPYGVLTPGDAGNRVQSINDEIAKYEQMMKTNRAEYNKPGNEQKYRQLLAERERLADQSKKAA